MISTLNQYFFVTLCVLFLAGSFVRAGEHGTTEAQKVREPASVVKELDVEEAVLVPNEDGEKLIGTFDKLEGKLKEFKTGNVSGEVDK